MITTSFMLAILVLNTTMILANTTVLIVSGGYILKEIKESKRY
ncbi:hypothetical protein [Neobacillus drentensis]